MSCGLSGSSSTTSPAASARSAAWVSDAIIARRPSARASGGTLPAITWTPVAPAAAAQSNAWSISARASAARPGTAARPTSPLSGSTSVLIPSSDTPRAAQRSATAAGGVA